MYEYWEWISDFGATSKQTFGLKNCRMSKTLPKILSKIGELAKVGVTKQCVQRKLIHTLTKQEIDTEGDFVELQFTTHQMRL